MILLNLQWTVDRRNGKKGARNAKKCKVEKWLFVGTLEKNVTKLLKEENNYILSLLCHQKFLTYLYYLQRICLIKICRADSLKHILGIFLKFYKGY